MKKFLLKVLFLLVLPFGIAGYALQYYIDKKLENSNLSGYNEWNAIFNSEINADILIMGNSRAVRHISPYVIDSVFGMNAYNLGITGYPFRMEYYKFQCYLNYNKLPKYIILNVDPITLQKGNSLFMPEQFIPYLNKDENIRKALEIYDVFKERDYYLPFFRYNHSDDTRKFIWQSLFADTAKAKMYKGFLMRDVPWDSAFANLKKSRPGGYKIVVDAETLGLFNSFVDYCNANKIRLIFVYTPEYYEGQKLMVNKDEVMKLFKDKADSFAIPFFDYANDSICLDTLNFFNSQHLNKTGATKFNRKFAEDLKSVIK
ncbi:MAG: hypothetical protein ABIQ40_14000 [Bacteroidia bacterium]